MFRRFVILTTAAVILNIGDLGICSALTNYLQGGYWDQANIGINVGDTVIWVYVSSGGPNFTESYGGEWKSPAFTNQGDSFSFTFTNAGFYAYRTGANPGTVTVTPAGDPPLPLTINTPIDGFVFPEGSSIPIQASPANDQSGVSRVEFFANANLLGATISAPYSIRWTNAATGDYVLTARSTDANGVVADSRPVRITIGRYGLFFPHLLKHGEVLFFFSVPPPPVRNCLGISKDVTVAQGALGMYRVAEYGTFVDETVAGVARRFYWLGGCR